MADDGYSQYETPPSGNQYSYEGYATTFADPKDLFHYRAAKRSGASEEQALSVGDNGRGSAYLGGIATSEAYGVAVPRWQLIKMFGDDPRAWRTARALVQIGQRTALVPIIDIGPGSVAQSRGVVSDLSNLLAQYLGSNGWSPVTISYRANAGPDYMTDQAAWYAEQAQFGRLSGYSQYERDYSKDDAGYKQFETLIQSRTGDGYSQVETPGKPKAEQQPAEEDGYKQYEVAGLKDVPGLGDVSRRTTPSLPKEPKPLIAPATGNWLLDRVNKIWKIAQADIASSAAGSAKATAYSSDATIQKILDAKDLSPERKQEEIDYIHQTLANDPFEEQIRETQISPYLSDQQRVETINALRARQKEFQAQELAKVPDIIRRAQEAQKEAIAANPNKLEEFAGHSLPYGIEGAVPVVGGFLAAERQTAQVYGEMFDEGMARARKVHPDWSEGKRLVEVNKAAVEASRASGVSALALNFVNVPGMGPLLMRMTQKVGTGVVSMELAGLYAEVQKDLALKNNIDPEQKIGERLKQWEFWVTNAWEGGIFGLPHAFAEIGKGEPFVVKVGEPKIRSIISNRQVIFPPNILTDKTGKPDDEQTRATPVEENGEYTPESTRAGEAKAVPAPQAEEKPTGEVPPDTKTQPEPVRETKGTTADLEESARRTRLRREAEAKSKRESEKLAARKGDPLYDRTQAVEWQHLSVDQKADILVETDRLLTHYFKQFKAIADRLGITLKRDNSYHTTADMDGNIMQLNVNPLRLAQLNYRRWYGGGLHWSRGEHFNALFQEELQHGAFFHFLREEAARRGVGAGTVAKEYATAIRNELQTAAKAARANGDIAGAEILEKAQEHSATIYNPRNVKEVREAGGDYGPWTDRVTPTSYMAELVRQLMQARARGRFSETWYRPLWDHVRRKYLAPAIRTLRGLVPRINPTDTPALFRVIDEAEKRYYQTLKPAPMAEPGPPETEQFGAKFPGEEFVLPLIEVVRKQPHTEELVKAFDNFRAIQGEHQGYWAQLNKILRQIKRYDKNFSTDIDGIGKGLDKNPIIGPILTTMQRNWFNVANNGLFRHIGNEMRNGGYDVKDSDGYVRQFIGAPKDVVPVSRIMRPDVKKVFEGRMRDRITKRFTKQAQELYDEGVREGIFTKEEDLEHWAAIYRRVYQSDDREARITNLERARQTKFPKFMYTYSPEAMLDQIFWQGTEIARLKAFGQKIHGKRRMPDGTEQAVNKEDLFDKTVAAIQADQTLKTSEITHAVNAVEALRKIAYGHGWRNAFVRTFRGVSSFGLAASPHTSLKIWSNMFFNVPQYRGLGNTLQGIWEHTFHHHEDIEYLRSLGLKQDLAINIYDDPYTTSNLQKKLQDFFTGGLRLAGHSLAQDNAKSITARISKRWIMDAIERFREDPGLTQAKTRQIAEDIGRRGMDWQVFAHGTVDPKLIDRFVREDVNDLQPAYRPEDYPAWASTQVGSVMFQFGHWAYNGARTIIRDSVWPMYKAMQANDYPLAAHYMLRLTGTFMAAAGAEETWRYLDEKIFGRQPHVALVGEIMRAMQNADGGTAIHMLTNRLVQDIIGSPVLGMWGDVSQGIIGIGRGQIDTTHFFDPRNPAGVAYLNVYINAINQYARQGGKMSAEQMSWAWTQGVGIIKGYYDIVEPVVGYFGIGLPGHNEAVAHREVSWVRSRQDLFYKMTGYPDHRESGKGGGPHTVYLQNLNEALISGNVAKAADIKRRYKTEMKLDDKTVNSSLRSSVNAHRPIPGGAAGQAFMKWAMRNLPPDEIARMRHINKVFSATAHAAGIPISAGADQ